VNRLRFGVRRDGPENRLRPDRAAAGRSLWHAETIGGSQDTSSFEELLERVASSDPVPGAGPAAAWTCALAAALVEMVCAVMARIESDEDAVRADRGERAAAIRAAALELAGRDMDAYREVLAARSSGDVGLRRAALAAAADPPLEIAAAAAELTALAAEAFATARGGVRGEAAAAAVLAEAVTRVAAAIVTFNLAGDPGDPRRVEAAELTLAAATQRARVEAY
jgi:formiminotetrahydrofolate cyclodeaminase